MGKRGCNSTPLYRVPSLHVAPVFTASRCLGSSSCDTARHCRQCRYAAITISYAQSETWKSGLSTPRDHATDRLLDHPTTTSLTKDTLISPCPMISNVSRGTTKPHHISLIPSGSLRIDQIASCCATTYISHAEMNRRSAHQKKFYCHLHRTEIENGKSGPAGTGTGEEFKRGWT